MLAASIISDLSSCWNREAQL